MALLWLALAASLTAAAPQTQNREPPVFGTGVTLVAVPVFVTDKNGRAVAGLTAADFEVEDGGKKVPIASFQALDADVPVTQEQLAALPPAVQAASPRQFLLFFDLAFSPTEGILRGRTAGMAFVRDALAPGDLVAVVMSSRNGLKVLSEFTTDHERVARAIEGMGQTGTYGRGLLGESGDLTAGASGRMAEYLAEMQGDVNAADQFLYKQTVTGFLHDLTQLVTMLSPLRGRKQVILLSGGFRASTWQGGAGPREFADSPMLGKMGDLFRASGLSDVVIHSISLAGLDAGSGRDTLVKISNDTGGRFIMPTNDFGKALVEVDRISRHSYVVAFDAADALGKGNKPRSLKVKVRRPGLSVSHRPFYSPPGPLPPAAVAALKTTAPLRLRLNTLSYRGADGKPSLHAVLQAEGPALVEASQGTQLAIQVYGYALRDGTVIDSLALNTSLDLAKLGEPVRKSGLSMIASFPVTPGITDLRFFLRSETPGVSGSIQRNVDVPAFDQGVVLSAPMFTLSPAGRVVAPLRSENRPPLKIPFYVGNSPFVPDPGPVLAPGIVSQACVLVWRAAGGSVAPFEVTGELKGPDGEARAVRIQGAPQVVPDPDGTDRYLVSIVPGDVAPGAYTLSLIFKDPATGATTRTETAVVVEK